jgi:predicted DNA-binding transcriptional regulator YafY
MKEKQLVNLLKAVDLMARTDGTTINELSAELGINRRAVYRLIETLESMHFPIYNDNTASERDKPWRLQSEYVKKMPNISVPELQLSFSEMLSLYLLKGEASLYKGTRLETEALSAFNKIGAFLPSPVFKQLDKIKTLFIPQSKFAKDYSGKEEIIDTLADAILTQKICMVSYFSFSDEKKKHYLIEPLHFFESNGGMYIFVRVPKHDSIRTLAVERIQKIDKSQETFEYPENFNPENLLESSFDIIYDDPLSARLWVSPEQAKYIRERKFFKNQTITENNDGSLILEIETSGWKDVKRWVMSLGAEAVVVGPEKLRLEIIDDLKSLLSRYNENQCPEGSALDCSGKS